MLNRDIPDVPMPTFVSHKRVRAAEIDRLVSLNDRERQVFFPEGSGIEPIILPESTFARFVPDPGDFLVLYDDSYVSFSPRKAFLEGYSPAQPAPGTSHLYDARQAPDRPALSGELSEADASHRG